MNRYVNLQRELIADPKCWLVTGAAGFIGSNLVEELLSLNQIVIGLDNFSTGHRQNLDLVKANVTVERWQNFQFIEGDVRNMAMCIDVLDNVPSELGASKVNCVLHQAALGSVPRSIDNPVLSNENNVNGFLNMITASCDMEVDAFVYAASSSTYGDHPGLPKKEDLIGKPLSPYAVTKLVNELYAEVFHKTYGFGSTGLRYFNVFGPRQDPHGAYAAVIPKWIAAMMSDEPVFINGDGHTSRDFCYVKNAVQANLLAAADQIRSSQSSVFNVACGQRTSLNELFSHIKTRLEKYSFNMVNKEPNYKKFRTGDVKHSLADITMISDQLGYLPTHKIEEGLDEAVGWYVQQAST